MAYSHRLAYVGSSRCDVTIKAYSYARYSTAVQGQGDSLRRQLKGCVDWVAEFEKNTGISLELDTRLRDLGVSSYTGVNRVRGALGSFLARVEWGEIERGSYLCVDSMDRLSRENETRVLNIVNGGAKPGQWGAVKPGH